MKTKFKLAVAVFLLILFTSLFVASYLLVARPLHLTVLAWAGLLSLPIFLVGAVKKKGGEG